LAQNRSAARRQSPLKVEFGTKPQCRLAEKARGPRHKVVSIGQAISAGPQTNREIQMSNRENQAGKYNLFTVAAVALALCGAALLMMPAPATSEGSSANAVTTSAAGEVGYLPAQYVNQAVEIQPIPAQF